ncbi:MAG: polysulfide reductase NrfD [Chloroflexi bacterium]|nr:polysulfide reductase NrfD [Chloroflexota bacterium]
MQITFTSVEGKSRKYKILAGILGLMTLVGIISYAISYSKGFRLWGINNSVIWGQLITVDIFFIGLSAGSLVVSSLTYVLGREEYKPIGRMAVFMGLLLMAGAMVSVLTDLGRAEKFWRLFGFFYTNNMTSMFAINGIFYGGYILLLLLYLGAALSGSNKTKIIAPIAVLWAVLVHTGTGAIFGFIQTRDILYSPMKPIEFVSAAIASGTALVMVISYLTLKFSGRDIPKNMFVSLGRLLSVLIIILVVLVAVDKLTHFYPAENDSILYLSQGPWAWIFWGMQITLGYVVPLVILFHPRWGKTLKGVLLAAGINVIGIFGERMGIIFPGLSEPLYLYPGDVQGIWGARGGFQITPAETLITVGIFCLLGFVYVLGIKYMNLLPPKKGAEGETQHETGRGRELG